MFSKVGALAGATALVFGFSGAASAATATFNLQAPGGYVDGGTSGSVSGNSLSMTNNGITATFTGHTITGGSFDGGTGVLSGATIDDADSIFRYNNGLGVRGDSGDDEHSIDAVTGTNDPVEFVQMAFSDGTGAVSVRLTQLIFGWVGGPRSGFTNCGTSCYDDTSGAFDIILDTVAGAIGNGDTRSFSGVMSTPSPNSPDAQGGYSSGIFSFTSGPVLVDDVFGIMAGNNGLPGSWKLRGVTVETTMAPPPPIIPLPAAAWLMLGGLGSLLALRRRRA